MTEGMQHGRRVVGYLRVSTDRQAEEGHGLDVQEAAVRRLAEVAGLELVGWHRDEGISGSKGVDERDGLQAALDQVRAGQADGVAAYNLDRIARSLTVQEAVLAYVWEHRGRVWTAEDRGEVLRDDPDDPMRTAMRQMRGVFAQLERAMITKRMRDGRKAKAAGGGYAFGAPPFGWRAEGGRLVEVTGEQAVIKRARQLRKRGLSLQAIADKLNEEGARTQRGSQWRKGAVQRILAR